MCLQTLPWARLLHHIFVLKGVLLDCRIEAAVDTLCPNAETIPFEQNTVLIQYCVNPALWFRAPHHSKQTNCGAAYLALSSQNPVTAAFPWLRWMWECSAALPDVCHMRSLTAPILLEALLCLSGSEVL